MKKLMPLFFLIMFVIGTDTFLISPLLPMLQQLFDVSTSVSGWMMGAYALGYAVFALIAGPLSDVWDRKKVMLAGMLAFSVSTFLCGFAHGFWSMFAFRFLAGVSAAFTAPQVWASIATLIPQPQMIKALGIATAGLAASQALGVPIGSMLAESNWTTPFFVIGIFAFVLLFYIAIALPSLKQQPSHTETKRILFKRYLPLLQSRNARILFLAYFVFQLGTFAAFTFIGKWLEDQFELSVSQVGTVMIFLGIGNLIGSSISAYAVKRINRLHALIWGIAILILLYILLPYASSIAYVTFAYFLIFTIGGILFPVMMGSLMSLNSTLRGTISSLTSSTMYAATTLGSWIAGNLYASFHGFASIGVFTAGCFLVSIFFFISSRTLSEPAARELQTNRG